MATMYKNRLLCIITNYVNEPWHIHIIHVRYSVENAHNLYDTFEPSLWYLFKCIFVKCGRLICPPVQAAGWEIYEAIFFKYCRINYLPGANWVKGLPSHPYIQRQMQTQLRKYKQGKKSRALHHIPPVGTIWVNWDKYNKNANTKTEAKTKNTVLLVIHLLDEMDRVGIRVKQSN